MECRWASLACLLALVCTVTGVSFDYVTCGSVVKLLNPAHQVRLHSHDVKYGSGSGQQSVTGMPDMDDHNSHWQLESGEGDSKCGRGQKIKCGTKVRFLHLSTGCRLHSHLFKSPLSGRQEVSCFGSANKGDTGDNWLLECEEDEEFWHRSEEVRFKHVDTGLYLQASAHEFGRPIAGQNEICADSRTGSDSLWKSAEGVFVKPPETDF